MDLPRLEAITLVLPEAIHVGEPKARRPASTVTSLDERSSSKRDATEPGAEPTGYGMGRHGWVTVDVGDDPDWEQVREWVRTSYTLVAPKTLARQVLAEDGIEEG